MPDQDQGATALKQIRTWALSCFGLGLVIAAATLLEPGESRYASFIEGDSAQVIGVGLGLCLFAAIAFMLRARLAKLLAVPADSQDSLLKDHPYAALFLVSLVILFIEVMFIRYTSSQLRIFAFYKNIPLISCFLGLGLGCFLRNGGSRHVLWFLLWILPLTAFLSQGALLVDNTLSVWGAAASTEFVLGDALFDSGQANALIRFNLQVAIGGFAVVALLAIAALFTLLGRLLGTAFDQVPRLPGYTMNILGSLAGILLFIALSYLQTPPAVWYLAGLLPLLAWVSGRRAASAALLLVGLSVLAVLPSRGETVWSPYQKLVGQETSDGGYWVQISDVFYQVALDLSPEAIAKRGDNPAPHYAGIYDGVPTPERVLVVGAGTGNDVAAALRAGASRVDAVDIDPAIISMGRAHHPERPYDDPRVHVIIDDARKAFRTLPENSYDAVVFGLLDSHTQLGMSSVRLDNYVFTLESLRAAGRLLRPGGHIMLSAAINPTWFVERFIAMLETVCSGPVDYRSYGGAPKSFVCQVDDPSQLAAAGHSYEGPKVLPSDDWPFLYLPGRTIPQAYLVVVAMLLFASVAYLRKGGLGLGSITPYRSHMFFLGAAFLLMEVYAINRLALLFGTTWLVSAVTIGVVLTLIVLANLTVAAVRMNLQKPAYVALFLCLVLSFWIEPQVVLGEGTALLLAYALFILSPIYFAGMVFAQSFRLSETAGPAIGANILGAVLGGWVEYATMMTGIKSMALLALALYLASLIALVVKSRPGKANQPAAQLS